MKREEAIRKLFKLKESHGIDITDKLNELNRIEGVSYEILSFINQYDYSIDTFFTYLSEKQFYKTIKNAKNEYEMLKGLSSLLTHIIIEIEKYPSRKTLIGEALHVDEILNCFYQYFLKNDLSETHNMVQKIQVLLKEKEGEN